MLLSVHVTSVLFLVWFWTHYRLLLELHALTLAAQPSLCALSSYTCKHTASLSCLWHTKTKGETWNILLLWWHQCLHRKTQQGGEWLPTEWTTLYPSTKTSCYSWKPWSPIILIRAHQTLLIQLMSAGTWGLTQTPHLTRKTVRHTKSNFLELAWDGLELPTPWLHACIWSQHYSATVQCLKSLWQFLKKDVTLTGCYGTVNNLAISLVLTIF